MFILGGVVLLAVLWIGWQYRPSGALPDLPPDMTLERAAWLGVEWSMDAHSDAEIEALAQELQAHEIDYAFVYVSYLKSGDFFNPTFDHAATFTQRMHELAPDVTLLAWVGVPIQMTQPDGVYVANRLESADVRAMIAEFGAQTVSELGFDGVHLNAELIPEGDEAFIATLEALRDALPPEAILSTAVHALRLTENVTDIPYPTMAHHWSADYLRRVAQNADQVALMAYDSGLPFPADYREWMAYQVRASADALSGVDVNFLIGVPTSEELTPSHNTTAESLTNALVGLRAGFAASDSPQVIDGLAVYPYWETSADEWALLDTLLHGS
ncbi:MAG: hypothetical protein H7175_20010 [Burkholderiales bacterium]|nr:hypothetical protein [Anaerolineae bacterium]